MSAPTDPISLFDFMHFRREAGEQKRLLRKNVSWPSEEVEWFTVFTTDHPDQLLHVAIHRNADGETYEAELATHDGGSMVADEDMLFQRHGWKMIDWWAWEHETLTDSLAELHNKAEKATSDADVAALVREFQRITNDARATLTEDRDGFYDDRTQAG